MREMLLFGAGASVDAGVPGAFKMTEKIIERFRTDYLLKEYSNVISFVIGGLLFQAGQSGQNPLAAGVNVEDLFNAVQLLAERHSLEAAPFVGSWHAMVEEFDRIRPSRSSNRSLGKIVYQVVSEQIRKALADTPSFSEARAIDSALSEVIKQAAAASAKGRSTANISSNVGKAVERYVKETAKKWSSGLKSASPSGDQEFEREISNLIDNRQLQPGEGRIFSQTNEIMINYLKDLVWISSPKSVAYLGPLVNFLHRQKRLVIATLNYDNGIEMLANSQGIPCHTGIEKWSEAGDFDFGGDGLHLLKLHGSIDWVWERNANSADRPMTHSIIRRAEHDVMMGRQVRPAVIFGQRNKLTAEGPFLDLLRAFREELSHSDLLTVVGYSFRDDHINVYISQWLNGTRNHVIRIINGANFETTPVGYVRELLALRASFPDQVEIITSYAGPGLRQLYGEYDGPFEDASVSEPASKKSEESSDTTYA